MCPDYVVCVPLGGPFKLVDSAAETHEAPYRTTLPIDLLQICFGLDSVCEYRVYH